jgi:hypothetical protein
MADAWRTSHAVGAQRRDIHIKINVNH